MDLKQRRIELGLTLEQVGNACGVGKSTVRKWEVGMISNMRRDKVVELARVLQVSPLDIVGRDLSVTADPITIRTLPVVGAIACGKPIEAIETHDEVLQFVGNGRADYALICAGDSMAPTVQSGDYVLIRQQTDVNDGQIAAVVIDGQATLKHVYHTATGLLLTADNPSYPPIMVSSHNVIINGIAVAFQRNLEV